MVALGGIVLGFSHILIPWLVIAAPPDTACAQSSSPPPFTQSQSPALLPPMPADASPSFDVAIIKPSDTSARHGTGIRTNGRHIAAFNFSVGELISYSYGLQAKQITDGASSILDARFDIDGVPDVVGHPNLAQSRLMFQKLLVSRFKLVFHYEFRELSAYAMQVAKGGPKLELTTSKPDDGTGFSYNCQVVLTVRNASVADIAKGMQEAFLDKPVVDQTGLHGRYDFDLRWTPNESQSYCPVDPAGSTYDPSAPPDLDTAIQNQIGLKLVPTKASVQMMVIDHLERPSEN